METDRTTVVKLTHRGGTVLAVRIEVLHPDVAFAMKNHLKGLPRVFQAVLILPATAVRVRFHIIRNARI